VSRTPAAELRPARHDVLERIGAGAEGQVTPRVEALMARAAGIFDRAVDPAAIYESVGSEEFARIYQGDGRNDADSPLPSIHPRADALALFAVTLGRRIDCEIRAIFAAGDAALGYMVDVFAALAADRYADLVSDAFLTDVLDGAHAGAMRVLPYSPGYCGWHVSGQRALFERLRPAEIDVTLTERCVMEPLKSVSGVFVAGAGAIHRFRPAFPFCDVCQTHDCRARIASVR
jgi:hypothetical protein